MVGRALSLAAVTLLIGCFAAAPAWAQATNLEAGKSPAQIFAGTCNACHKSAHGLLKSVSPGSLPSYLRQHYTTSSEMASLLAAYVISNGATDTRYVGGQPKGAKDANAKPGAPAPVEQLDRFGRRVRPGAPAAAPTQEAAKPDADVTVPPGTTKRLARPAEPSDATKPATEGQPPVEAAIERGPDGGKLTAKQKLSKRGKPEEPPKLDTGKEEPAKSEAAREDKPASETAKEEGAKPEATKPEVAKPEGTKPAAEPKSETAKIEMPKATRNASSPALRADPVPPVTPAPAAPAPVAAAPASPAPATPAPSAPTVPAVVSSAPPPAPTPPMPPPALLDAPPTVTASAPPPEPPVTPAGPPSPPISQ